MEHLPGICSFCGREEKPGQAAFVITGPAVYICNVCVWLAVDILESENIHRYEGPWPNKEEKQNE